MASIKQGFGATSWDSEFDRRWGDAADRTPVATRAPLIGEALRCESGSCASNWSGLQVLLQLEQTSRESAVVAIASSTLHISSGQRWSELIDPRLSQRYNHCRKSQLRQQGCPSAQMQAVIIPRELRVGLSPMSSTPLNPSSSCNRPTAPTAQRLPAVVAK